MASTTREAQVKRLREIYNNRRGAAIEQSERRKDALYFEVDGLRELDAEMAATAMGIMRAAMSGGNVEENIASLKARNKEIRKKRGELLLANGYPADYTDVKYNCPVCKDTGYVDINLCSCFKQELAMAMLDASGLGKLAREQSFENFDLRYYTESSRNHIKDACAALKHFAENFSKETKDSFLLCGDTGLGKTHLSTAAAVKIIERGYEVCYVTMQAMVDDFSDCQFRGEGRESVRKYYDSDLLILDDMGTEMVNQFTITCMYNVLNHRVNNGMPMIISTNLKPEDILKKYDARITSRLFGSFKCVKFEGHDVRLAKLRER